MRTLPGGGEKARDRREDRRVLLVTAGILLTAFGIGAVAQTIFVFRPERLGLDELIGRSPHLSDRLIANATAVVFVLVAAYLTRLAERRAAAAIALVLGISVGAGSARHAVQIALGIYERPEIRTSLVEIASVVVVAALALTFGLVQVRGRVRAREHARQSAAQRVRASAALAELAAEEVRVRREVAEGLHGTLQGRLVLTQARLAALVERGRAEGWDSAEIEQLTELERDLEAIRENDVRALSQLIYPVGVDLGLRQALRALLRRVPAEIEIVSDIPVEAENALAGSGAEAVGRRIAVIRVVEEGITNALRHGAATSIRIAAELVDTEESLRVRVTVDDDGVGLPAAPDLRGADRSGDLALVADRVGLRGGSVTLASSPLGGARLTADLPLASP